MKNAGQTYPEAFQCQFTPSQPIILVSSILFHVETLGSSSLETWLILNLHPMTTKCLLTQFHHRLQLSIDFYK
jgi:hypothetical protein